MRTLVLMNVVTGEELRFPTLPKDISFQHGVTTNSVSLDQLGAFSWPIGRDPTTFSFSGTFWGPDRATLPFMQEYRVPDDCIQLLEWWHDNQYGNYVPDRKPQRLRLTLTASALNKDVYISSFTHRYTGAMGDIEYDLTLTEWRSLMVFEDTPETPSVQAGSELSGATQESDQDAPALESTYTVQAGDTLSSMAKRLLGDSARWPEIYDVPANIEVVGGDPNKIAPGMVLQIPGGSPAQTEFEDEPSTPTFWQLGTPVTR